MTENERLKEVRKRLGLTLNEMGAKVGVTASAISYVETGKAKLSNRLITAICVVFPQVSETWLRDGTGDMLQPIPEETDRIIDGLDVPEVCKEFLHAFARLDAEAQAHVNAYIRGVVAGLLGAPDKYPPSVETGQNGADLGKSGADLGINGADLGINGAEMGKNGAEMGNAKKPPETAADIAQELEQYRGELEAAKEKTLHQSIGIPGTSRGA